MTPRELEEYRALRDTIRERGTTRIWLAFCGFIAWAALVLATMTFSPLPIAALLPLLVLAAAFECVFAVHTAVERVGRYLQVFYEGADASARRWEHTAMAFGRQFPGGGTDPLFGGLFGLAAVFNLIPVAAAGAIPVEYAIVGGFHAVFLFRIVQARRLASRQRARDLERFEQLRNTAV